MGNKPYSWSVHQGWAKAHPFREGMICPRCGNPMFKRQGVDIGHVVDAALGGGDGPRRWEHTRCNRSAGAVLGSRLRRNKTRPIVNPNSERW